MTSKKDALLFNLSEAFNNRCFASWQVEARAKDVALMGSTATRYVREWAEKKLLGLRAIPDEEAKELGLVTMQDRTRVRWYEFRPDHINSCQK